MVNSLGVFAGFCYTQFADTYQEGNGLLWADRTPKFPLDRIARATTGGAPIEDAKADLGEPSASAAGGRQSGNIGPVR